ncbi:helix-turn-helix domain-containing protein [Dyadobacter chenwenxiniae]|uniref:Helix-turn-helix domain-containing protein n=1 Tax=Dyadobacter chenwenxiniae TaxID=2906456 RepID=A0A9X1PTV7_9BACT|nr:AraC family transcriptional regulator [Dyadobacter chenwenxiniae]MCF0065538.1 helix-turn-helix domain-containing protein [Dyadobacter chenwenxiniae]UON85448.1 helix-turn-helix domain-containing protein [Dyadobacter chenwenxiniae]
MAEQQQNKFASIVWAVTEDKFYKDEIILEFHSFVRIISGEMKVVQAENSYMFGAGDTLLFPRNQLSAVIKRPKDGRPYKAVVLGLTTERLKEFYTKHTLQPILPLAHKTRKFDPHPLLDGFFASLASYFELEDELPIDIARLKLEEAISILRSLDNNIDSLLADFSQPGKISLADFMEKHYMFNMPIEKFGYLTGRSLSTFHRDFKKAFYTSPQKWLTKKRLELAHYQLSEKHRKPVEVYLEAGFENLSHFSFAFKKQFGYAPTNLI